jgi:hypothetical protein
VPRFPAVLSRFRRFLAPPGRPGQALGVPASGEDVAAELAPLLARLEAIDAQATQIEEQAEADARRAHERGERESSAILEQGRMRADAERVRAAAEQRVQARQNGELARETARREAARIRAMRDAAVAELVEEVVACVRRTGR